MVQKTHVLEKQPVREAMCQATPDRSMWLTLPFIWSSSLHSPAASQEPPSHGMSSTTRRPHTLSLHGGLFCPRKHSQGTSTFHIRSSQGTFPSASSLSFDPMAQHCWCPVAADGSLVGRVFPGMH